jgi:hypothetical protein
MSNEHRQKQGARPRLIPRLIISGAALALALIALRYGVIENGLLPRNCDASAPSWACMLTGLLVQGFQAQRLGWLALACGAAGFLFNARILAWAGWFLGVAGMVLYCEDYAAPGALLGLFTLLRDTLLQDNGPAPAAGEPLPEHGQGERQAGQ